MTTHHMGGQGRAVEWVAGARSRAAGHTPCTPFQRPCQLPRSSAPRALPALTRLRLLNAAPVGQAPALRQAVDVRVNRERGLPKGLAHDHAACMGGGVGGWGGILKHQQAGRQVGRARLQTEGHAEPATLPRPIWRQQASKHVHESTPGGLVAHPRKLLQSLQAGRHLPAVLLHQQLRCAAGREQGKQCGHRLRSWQPQVSAHLAASQARGTAMHAATRPWRTWLMAFRFLALVGARPSVRMQAAMSDTSAAAMVGASGARRHSAGVHSFTFLSVV